MIFNKKIILCAMIGLLGQGCMAGDCPRSGNSRSGNLIGPLEWAARLGNLEEIKRLYEQEVDPLGPEQIQALRAAAARGHLGVVRYLCEQGVKPDAVFCSSPTAFWLAAREGHVKVVEYLLGVGADINAKDIAGRTALCVAGQKGHVKVIECLLKNGAVPILGIAEIAGSSIKNNAFIAGLLAATKDFRIEYLTRFCNNPSDNLSILEPEQRYKLLQYVALAGSTEATQAVLRAGDIAVPQKGLLLSPRVCAIIGGLPSAMIEAMPATEEDTPQFLCSLANKHKRPEVSAACLTLFAIGAHLLRFKL